MLLQATASVGCKRKHVSVDSVPELGYPSCADAGPPTGERKGDLLGKEALRAGPFMREKSVVEAFEIRKTSCQYIFDGHEEWPLMSADVQVVYDENLMPLRAWKRMTIPGSSRADGNADTRRYELRTPDVTIKHKASNGEILYELLKPSGRVPVPIGAHVAAVIAPGRGVISMWIRRTKLPVGGKVRELVLDFREMVEVLEEGTLVREDDRFEESLGKSVRVYTILGRESVFADENGDVIGDLAGLRPSDSLTTPVPLPMPTYGAPDPINTP